MLSVTIIIIIIIIIIIVIIIIIIVVFFFPSAEGANWSFYFLYALLTL